MEEIALALACCLALAFVSKRWSLPAIPFYILAGVVLGQSGLGLVPADEYTQYLSYLGLIFLLFYVGLEIRPKSLLRQGKSLLISGFIDLNVNFILAFVCALSLAFPLLDALVIGAALYVSSSAIAVASLVENRKLLLPESETVVWLMVIEDIILILLLSFFTAGAGNPLVVATAIVAVTLTLFAVVRAGKTFIPALLSRNDEIPVLFTFTAVVSTLYLSRLLKIPEALMAIILGSSLSSTGAHLLERLSQPFRDVFLVLFFVFFGITVDFSGITSIYPIVALTVVAIGSKVLTGLLVGRILHGSYAAGMEIGSTIIARGEFSIAFAAIYGSGVISAILAAVVILTSLAGSFTARFSDRLKAIFLPGREGGSAP
ncbi:MAG: cation:proton antiporter [Methanomicrobiales archaeon]|nr:cation:proton antiporter [Methanomicrobiales archaeon]